MSLEDLGIIAAILSPVFGYLLGRINKCTKEIEVMKTEKEIIKQSVDVQEKLLEKHSKCLIDLNQEVEQNEKTNVEKFQNIKDLLSSHTLKIQDTINSNYVQLLEKIGNAS